MIYLIKLLTSLFIKPLGFVFGWSGFDSSHGIIASTILVLLIIEAGFFRYVLGVSSLDIFLRNNWNKVLFGIGLALNFWTGFWLPFFGTLILIAQILWFLFESKKETESEADDNQAPKKRSLSDRLNSAWTEFKKEL